MTEETPLQEESKHDLDVTCPSCNTKFGIALKSDPVEETPLDATHGGADEVETPAAETPETPEPETPVPETVVEELVVPETPVVEPVAEQAVDAPETPETPIVEEEEEEEDVAAEVEATPEVAPVIDVEAIKAEITGVFQSQIDDMKTKMVEVASNYDTIEKKYRNLLVDKVLSAESFGSEKPLAETRKDELQSMEFGTLEDLSNKSEEEPNGASGKAEHGVPKTLQIYNQTYGIN